MLFLQINARNKKYKHRNHVLLFNVKYIYNNNNCLDLIKSPCAHYRLTSWRGFVRFLIGTKREHSSHEDVWETWNHLIRQLSWTHLADPAHLQGLIKTSSPLLWQMRHSSSPSVKQPAFFVSPAGREFERNADSSMHVHFRLSSNFSLGSLLPLASQISPFLEDTAICKSHGSSVLRSPFTAGSFAVDRCVSALSRCHVTTVSFVELSEKSSLSVLALGPSMS